MALTHADVVSALSGVQDPELRSPITELDMVGDITVSDSSLAVQINLTIVGCPAADTIEADTRRALLTVVGERTLDLTIGVMGPQQRADLISRLRKGKAPSNPFTPDSLTRVIAVTSGKGGVGKSSITANLAAAVSQQGFRVGIIDADVFGFSIPGLLGIPSLQPTRIDDMMLPPLGHDIKVLSIGMFVGTEQAVAWRGPLLHRTLEQFLTDSYFGDLDFLFLDLPPGTGDIAISVGQLLPHAEVLVVTTPQHSASDVAWRSGDVARQTGQKVLGVIENMSAVTLPDGTTLDIFGSGGGHEVATRLGVPLLGSIPLSPALREAGDAGIPLVIGAPGDTVSQRVIEIAHAIVTSGDSKVGVKLPMSPRQA
jgi:ATP-binding protein involved in chromosome partitioning